MLTKNVGWITASTPARIKNMANNWTVPTLSFMNILPSKTPNIILDEWNDFMSDGVRNFMAVNLQLNPIDPTIPLNKSILRALLGPSRLRRLYWAISRWIFHMQKISFEYLLKKNLLRSFSFQLKHLRVNILIKRSRFQFFLFC